MAGETSYPSPSAAQIAGGAGPFFAQNGGEQAQIPNDLQQLQAAEIPRSQASFMENAINGGHQYAQAGHPAHDASRQPSSPQRLAQGVLGISGQDDYQSSEGPRKRSKVSRACDECRRKKIRCDATTESSDDGPCANCKRTGAHCQFSRQPMKRGPSKGYIKELADRLNTLETQLGPQGQHMHQADLQYMRTLADEGMAQHMGEAQDYSPPRGPQGPRKRTYSMSEEGMFSKEHPYAPARQAGSGAWSAEPPRHLPHPGSGLGPTQAPAPYSAASETHRLPNLQERQLSPKIGGLWRYVAPDSGRGEHVSIPYDAEGRDADPAALQSWDGSVVDEYYRIIHQTFPLLPHSKMRLRSRLTNCPATLREAFLVALDCAIRSSPSSHLQSSPDLRQSTKKAAELISASQYESAATHTMATNIIYLQTLILMALESDNHGPATMRGQSGPPRAEWLGRAIGMATHLKLNVAHSRDRYDGDDPDADDKIGRRVWWILFILDRWHASSTSSLLQLPDNGSVLLPDDQIMLGESTYHLARLSYILGHLSTIFQQASSLMSPTSAAAPVISTILLGEIDRFRESVEGLLQGTPNLVHLTYWHVRLLVLRLTSSTSPHELLTPAMRMAKILNSVYMVITPLSHHFVALSALTLVELSDFEETRRAAESGMDEIIQALTSRKVLTSKEDGLGWDSAVRELVMKRKMQISASGDRGSATGVAAVGLQHLADAAISGNRRPGTPTSAGAASITSPLVAKQQSDAPVGSCFDPTALSRYGYLAALAQDNYGVR